MKEELPIAIVKPDLRRFTDDSHVTAEEAGLVVTPDGRPIFPGSSGFLEALSEVYGFNLENETLQNLSKLSVQIKKNPFQYFCPYNILLASL